ncbi:MAG: SAM-dependent DNA methyltransferase [Dehalococcoidia bacterium]|nr:SAM-dependent DNA methyltransferase [Dehalococcoidia bacterium]
MQPLDRQHRNQLQRVVEEARQVAEAGALAALRHLGVELTQPPSYLSEHERVLYEKLRVHALLNRMPEEPEKEAFSPLVEEVAYEHWHRMLFARFLAENGLLMYPDPNHPVPVTLEECGELAPEYKARDGWELASRFAQGMLPQVFRKDSPLFELVLPPEHQSRLTRLVEGLPPDVFGASDSIGWVYQSWQGKRKDEVNRSEAKIGARELPAVTQLFTEPYMVSFLLDNSIGAWWASHVLSEVDLCDANSEETLRARAGTPSVPLEYLRFVKDDDGGWSPAGGTQDAWSPDLKDFRLLDPCCGSGHFLVAAFHMLVPMRMKAEGLSARDAVDSVLSENLYGLEIDRRCVELAAFALAFAAWSYPGAGGYRRLPAVNVACCGQAVGADRQSWESLAGGDKSLMFALQALHEEFRQAPLLGSLIDPQSRLSRFGLAAAQWQEVAPLLERALEGEDDYGRNEMAVAALGLAGAARILSLKYHLVTTNPPYLKSARQSEELKRFCAKAYGHAKNDLATVFLLRCLGLCVPGGNVSIVLPQGWLFLTSYRNFRVPLLRGETWNVLARLGAGAFETITGEVVQAVLLSITCGRSLSEDSVLGQSGKHDNLIACIEASEQREPAQKAEVLRIGTILRASQADQLENPDARVMSQYPGACALLAAHASGLQGVSPADTPRFGRVFWELENLCGSWRRWQGSADATVAFGGREMVLWWSPGLLDAFSTGQAALRGIDAWGKSGIAVRKIGHLPVTLYCGETFNTNCQVVLVEDASLLPPVWCFCSSPDYNSAIRRIDQKLDVTNATLVKVPFDLEYWQKVAQERYPNGLPEPYSDDPTQWVFHGHPCASVVWSEIEKRLVYGPLRTDDTVLQVAVARLLGYRWPTELDSELKLSAESRERVESCNNLLQYADGDGIVCIPATGGERSAADRLLDLLAASYGDEWNNNTLDALIAAVGHKGKSLESWLRDRFFEQHCALFHHRPFIWQVWDGLKDGFSVLLNYHKLNRKNLETLTYSYLNDWINRQKQACASNVDGAEERLAAAESLKKHLELILEGEKPYDIFVRWKPIEQQPIGWDPDLNDGVRLNIRPFMMPPDVRVKGAGVLRDRPNINWNKDRGKDVASAPWFHKFNGDRINDDNLTLAEKQKAKSLKQGA